MYVRTQSQHMLLPGSPSLTSPGHFTVGITVFLCPSPPIPVFFGVNTEQLVNIISKQILKPLGMLWTQQSRLSASTWVSKDSKLILNFKLPEAMKGRQKKKIVVLSVFTLDKIIMEHGICAILSFFCTSISVFSTTESIKWFTGVLHQISLLSQLKRLPFFFSY